MQKKTVKPGYVPARYLKLLAKEDIFIANAFRYNRILEIIPFVKNKIFKK